MTSGLELSIAKSLIPLIGILAKGTNDSLRKFLSRWNASDAASRLALKLVHADRIKTIWAPDKETSLLSIYYPSKVIIDNQSKPVHSLKDLPDENIVIEGIVGHGKSIFLRYLYLQELAGSGKGCLPLFIELRTLSEKRDLFVHILDALDKIDVDPNIEIFNYLAKSEKLILLLDGFDELDDDLVKTTIETIEFLSEKYESLRIVITSRPAADIQKSRVFRTLPLLGLESSDYHQFLRQLGVNSEKSLEIVEAIRNSPSDVVNLIKTPLMMTLLLVVYESEERIPSELPEFFDKLFSTMFTRHDRLKAGFVRRHYSGLSERNLQRFFETFCFFVMQQGFGRSLTTNQFSHAFDKACKYDSGAICDLEKFRKDIINVACLMLEEGFDLTTFLHKSIAEYFAASFVKKLSDELAAKFYNEATRNHRNWEGVITFLEGIDEYRISKNYWVPALDALFDNLSNFDGSKNIWIEFFCESQATFGVSYSSRSKREGEDGFRPNSWGSYTHHYPMNNEIHTKIVRAAIDGLKENIPATIDENILIEQVRIFKREEKNDGEIAYKILFKEAIEEYGTSGVEKAFNRLSNEMRRRNESVRHIVEREEAREQMFKKDFFDY